MNAHASQPELLAYTILASGDLKLTISSEGVEELKERRTNPSSYYSISEFIFDCPETSDLCFINPEDIGALTEAPIFTESFYPEDSGELVQSGKVWMHTNYMLESACEVLIEKGEITLPMMYDSQSPLTYPDPCSPAAENMRWDSCMNCLSKP